MKKKFFFISTLVLGTVGISLFAVKTSKSMDNGPKWHRIVCPNNGIGYQCVFGPSPVQNCSGPAVSCIYN